MQKIEPAQQVSSNNAHENQDIENLGALEETNENVE
jgi:hypothetical protein